MRRDAEDARWFLWWLLCWAATTLRDLERVSAETVLAEMLEGDDE